MESIILSSGTEVSPEDIQKIASAVNDLLLTTSKDPGQYEEADSLQGISSLPVFRQMGSAYELVRVAVSILKGVDGKQIVLQVTDDYIQWRYEDGNWSNLIALADIRGEKPLFRLSSEGIEYKYEDEKDSAWRLLVPIDSLRLHFSDLTPEQVDEIKLHFSDLTEADISELRKPATDAAKLANEAAIAATDATREANAAAISANDAAGNANEAATAANEAAGSATASATAADNAANKALNLPKIQGGTWWTYSTSTNEYTDTGTKATGRSPYIQAGTWWVYNDNTGEYENTNVSVSSTYELTKEKVEAVLTGDITTHNHNTQLLAALGNYTLSTDSRLSDRRDPRANLLTNEDLDDYTYDKAGFYYAGGGNSVLNRPNDVGAFGLVVIRQATGWTFQWLANGSAWYYRFHNDSTWSEWKRTYTEDYKPATISGNAATASKLANARAIDGVNFDGSGNITHYGTCSTAAATAAKTVTLPGFVLATGARVVVRFSATNTASNPTLDVNGTGAKAIYYRGAAVSPGYLSANRTIEFVYNGNQWEVIGDFDTNTTYNQASSSTLGLVKIGYSANNKNYPVNLDGDGKMYVSVPWTDTNTTYTQANSTTLGLVKIGYSENGKNYPVELDSSGKMFVNVPWTDNNTTYAQATADKLGLVRIGYAASGKSYAVALDSNGKMYVNVPWTDTNTTYAQANSTTLGLVKIGYVENGKNYPVELSDGKMFVNVPWTDTNTTYGVVGTNGSTGLVKNGSAVTSASGYTACPIVGGVPYYKDTNTTYDVATTSKNGLMSSTDKAKLDKTRPITISTSAPSGGNDGDIWIQYS